MSKTSRQRALSLKVLVMPPVPGEPRVLIFHRYPVKPKSQFIQWMGKNQPYLECRLFKVLLAPRGI
jgi:hypothetical protein